MMMKQLSSYNGRSMCILLEMSTPSCVQSAWKQQLNSCTTDYCRGWTKTHFLSCCFAQESPLHHVVMTSTTNPPHESGAFQFSLTFRGPLTDLCRPVILSWFWVHIAYMIHMNKNEAMEHCVHKHVGRTGRRSQQGGIGVWSSGPGIPPISTQPTEPQGAWRPEGPWLPATPSALLEKRSPSCITRCWATLTYMDLSDSVTSSLAVMKRRSGLVCFDK